MRSSSSPSTAPSKPTVSSAVSRSSPPAYTSDPSMSGAKRLPSSSVKKATASGWRVRTPASSRARTTSRPASTPRVPSYRPPVRTVSMWLPVITAGRSASAPARVATTLPTRSTRTSSPRSRIQPATSSRPPASSSVSASRQLPPSPVSPTAARAARSASSRSIWISTVSTAAPFNPGCPALAVRSLGLARTMSAKSAAKAAESTPFGVSYRRPRRVCIDRRFPRVDAHSLDH